MKKAQRILSAGLSIILIITIFGLCPTANADNSYIDASYSAIMKRIDQLYDVFNTEKYFTTTRKEACGAKTKGHGCSNCLLSNIMKKDWFQQEFGKVNTDQIPNTYKVSGEKGGRDGKSCYGFAAFAEWYIFHNSQTDIVDTNYIGTIAYDYETVSKTIKPGDLLRSDGHSFIAISYDEDGVMVLDSNYVGSYNCQVAKHTIKYSKYEKVAVSRVELKEQPKLTQFSADMTYSNLHDMTVSIFGTETCYNSHIMLDNVVKSKIDKQSNIRVLYVDCSYKTKEEMDVKRQAYINSGITFCYDTSGEAVSTMWDFATKAGFGKSIATPLVVLRKSDGTIFRTFQGGIDAVYLAQIANGDTSGEEIVNLKVTGQENYNYANEVLKQLNDLRRGLGLNNLKMDSKLMTAAMQRAAELSIYYSSTHTRPNGKHCTTVLEENDGGNHGENIAMGQMAPGQVMNSWKNSKGHYANMTNKDFNSVGIGCFKTSSGILCWVQIFSSASTTGWIEKINVIAEHNVEAQKIYLNLKSSVDKDMHTLANGKTAKIRIWNENKGVINAKQDVSSSTFNLSTSNSKVAVVNSSGKVTIKGNGKVTIIAKPKSGADLNLQQSYTIGHTYKNACDTTCDICGIKRSITHKYKTTIKDATLKKDGSIVKKCTVCGKETKTTIKRIKSVKLSATSYTYNGKAKKPSVTVKDSAGKKLTNKTDYTVSYAKGREKVGAYEVKIKFKGDYSGTKILKFEISPPKTKISKVSAEKNKITVAVSKKKTQISGYQIECSTSKKFSSSKTEAKTLKNYKSTKYTFKGLKAKKTYFVRVRTYKTVDGKKYYSAWSSYKSKKTK